MVKAVAALAQSAYALYTLYRARGDQINQFGYAAFGLTVAPYAVMSIMNLLGNLCRPEYPSLYMVESSIMDEARQRGGLFDGAVGRIKENESRTVCGCGFAGGEDIDDLHFMTDNTDEVVAHFSTARKHWCEQPNEVDGAMNVEPSASVEKLSPISSLPYPGQISHTFLIAPLPKKLNYYNMESPLMLFVPCHTPIVRSPTAPGIPPTRHAVSSIKLSRYWIFIKYYTWKLHYQPSHFLALAHRWRGLKYLLTAIVSLTPILLVGLLSHFQLGSIPATESSTWRAFTVQWLCLGSVTGLWFVFDQERKDTMPNEEAQVGPALRAFVYVTSASPAFGGYIVVGQMLARYGVCSWVGD
ncbi:hypothetical protein GQ44DRAFT_778475 [Phaeosphaeriaceae sp. PMI808]|nr:hypothetical protein GQ44DRAFT_778475 [Phaeosphaeriaceae sp. PMI808]